MEDHNSSAFEKAGQNLDANLGEKNSQEVSSHMLTTSITPKDENQDAHADLKATEAGFSAMVVADGIGSYDKASTAAISAVEFLAQSLKSVEKPEEIDFEQLFFSVQKNLSLSGIQQNGKSYTLGTTLICVIETESSFTCAYVGNGAILHIRGNFIDIPRRIRPIPWNAVNYLNPHSIMQEGKEALTRYLSNDDKTEEMLYQQAMPTVFTLHKDRGEGDCLLIMTDGIYSEDQVAFGFSEAGDLLFVSPPSMILLFQHLEKILTQESSLAFSKEDLRLFLDEYLKNLKENNLLSDDASIGICMTQEFARYHQKSLIL